MEKIWHFIVSAALVLIFYLLQICICFSEQHQSQQRQRFSETFRLLVAGTATLAIGILKEILQATNAFPWCQTDLQDDTCRFDGWNILFDVNGVTAAVLYIVAGRNLCRSTPPRDAATVASVDDDDKDEEHIIIAAIATTSVAGGLHGDAHDCWDCIQDGQVQ